MSLKASIRYDTGERAHGSVGFVDNLDRQDGAHNIGIKRPSRSRLMYVLTCFVLSERCLSIHQMSMVKRCAVGE